MSSHSSSHPSGSSSQDVEDKEKLDGTSVQQVVGVKEEAPETFYVSKYGVLGPLLAKLFASGVEARGIERVPEDQRDMKNSWNT